MNNRTRTLISLFAAITLVAAACSPARDETPVATQPPTTTETAADTTPETTPLVTADRDRLAEPTTTTAPEAEPAATPIAPEIRFAEGPVAVITDPDGLGGEHGYVAASWLTDPADASCSVRITDPDGVVLHKSVWADHRGTAAYRSHAWPSLFAVACRVLPYGDTAELNVPIHALVGSEYDTDAELAAAINAAPVGGADDQVPELPEQTPRGDELADDELADDPTPAGVAYLGTMPTLPHDGCAPDPQNWGVPGVPEGEPGSQQWLDAAYADWDTEWIDAASFSGGTYRLAVGWYDDAVIAEMLGEGITAELLIEADVEGPDSAAEQLIDQLLDLAPWVTQAIDLGSYPALVQIVDAFEDVQNLGTQLSEQKPFDVALLPQVIVEYVRARYVMQPYTQQPFVWTVAAAVDANGADCVARAAVEICRRAVSSGGAPTSHEDLWLGDGPLNHWLAHLACDARGTSLR